MSATQAMIGYIEARDHRLMRRVHRWPAPRWFRLWMICATRGGDGWLWYLLAGALFAAHGWEALPTVLTAMFAAGVGIAVFLALKRVTGRRRPCHMEPHCWSTLLPPDRFSFPSGHTITAFAICVPVALYNPGLTPPLSVCAMSIAASRIALGMHFLSDVVAGAAIGSVLGWAAYGLGAGRIM
ncbi:MAG: phosphatase PAP2 family protein [Bryobacteraceae bacterium]